MKRTPSKSIVRFGIYWVNLDPTIGHEVKKTRPCVVISPDDMNRHLGTVVVAPITSKPRDYPCRIPLFFNKTKGEVMFDQMRSVDKSRLTKKSGSLSKSEAQAACRVLQEMFAA